MLELIIVSAPFVMAGFGIGYFVRDCLSWRRHRVAARRHGHWHRHPRDDFPGGPEGMSMVPARPADPHTTTASSGWFKPAPSLA